MNNEELEPKDINQEQVPISMAGDPLDPPIQENDDPQSVKNRKKRQVAAQQPVGDIEDFVEIRDLTPVTKAKDTDLFLIDDGSVSTNSIKFKDLLNTIKDRTFKSDVAEEKTYLEGIIKGAISETLREDDDFFNRIYEKVTNRLKDDDSTAKKIFTEGFDELDSDEKKKHGESILEELDKEDLNTHSTYSIYSTDNYYFVGRHSDYGNKFKQYKIPNRVFAEVPSSYSSSSLIRQTVPFTGGVTSQYRFNRQGDDTWLPITGSYYVELGHLSQLENKRVLFSFGSLREVGMTTNQNTCYAIGVPEVAANKSKYVYLDWEISRRSYRTSSDTSAYCHLIVLYNGTQYSHLGDSLVKQRIMQDLMSVGRTSNVTILYHFFTNYTNGTIAERNPLLQGWYKVINSSNNCPRLLKI